MTSDKIVSILKNIRYKGGWYVTLKPMGDGFALQWEFYAIDVVSKKMAQQKGRKWYISPHATESEIVGTAFMAALAAEEHESREIFQYKGSRPYQPHFSVNDLCLLDESGNADVRTPPSGVPISVGSGNSVGDSDRG